MMRGLRRWDPCGLVAVYGSRCATTSSHLWRAIDGQVLLRRCGGGGGCLPHSLNTFQIAASSTTIFSRRWSSSTSHNQSQQQHHHEHEHEDSGRNGHSGSDHNGGSGRSSSSPQPPTVAEMQRAFLVFGIAPTSSYADIRKRFLELTRAHHPDIVCPIAAAAAVAAAGRGGGNAQEERNGSVARSGGCDGSATTNAEAAATEMMSSINEAYETLRRAHAASRLPDDLKHKATNQDHRCQNTSPSSAQRQKHHAHAPSGPGVKSKSTPSGGGGGWPFGFGRRPENRHNNASHHASSSSSHNGKQRGSDAPEDGIEDDDCSSWTHHEAYGSASQRPPNPTIRSDASRRSLRFLYNEATPALRNPFIETKEEEAPNFEGYYHQRTYAKTVSGRTVTTRFDIATRSFVLVFCGDPFCESNITKIVLHEALHYPHGFEVHLAVSAAAATAAASGGSGGSADQGDRKRADCCAAAAVASMMSSSSSSLSHLAKWRHVSKDLVEIEHDRTKVGLARLQVTVCIQACPGDSSSSTSPPAAAFASP